MSVEVAETLVKTPGESILYGFDFTLLLGSGETLSAVSSVAADTPTGATALTIGTPSYSGPVAQARISGGTSGYRYLVTCTVTTSAGNTRQCLGRLAIG